METDVSVLNELVDKTSNLPLPHLSFIINLLLPKRTVGLERTKRQFQTLQELRLRDPILNDGFFNVVLVGSSAEGYNIPDAISRSNPFKVETNADADVLFEITALKVLVDENYPKHITEDEVKCILDTNKCHPGYGKVRFRKEPKEADDTFIFVPKENKHFLSGTKLQSKLFSNISSMSQNVELHGPALSTHSMMEKSMQEVLKFSDSKDKPQLHDHDYVYALPCVGWPENANSWIERQEKHTWISADMLSNIKEKGINLVAVPHRLSDCPDLDWRISFATVEVFIAQNVITDEQRQCFVFLKIIYAQTLKNLGLLTSYHLKTIFLYACEKLPQQAWVDNIGACLLFLIDLLIERLKAKFLPNFFIPENNMIDYFSDDQIRQCLDVLRDVRERPIQPVLEFTETRTLGLQSYSTPFKDLISPVLEDSVNFLGHRDIQKSVSEAFLSTMFKFVVVLALEQKPEESIRTIIDVFPFIKKYCPASFNVAQLIDSIAMNYIKDISLTVKLLEEAQNYSDKFPDILLLRGNLACMFHALAYTKPAESEERLLAMIQAETLFNTVVDVENTNSASVVDFSCLLINQGRFDEAAEKLDRFIESELKKRSATSMHCFYKKEATVLDKTLQKEVKVRGQFAVNSLSMAYYLLVKCVLKDDPNSADKEVYTKILRYFTEHCNRLNDSSSFSLLGYAYLLVNAYAAAHEAFEKALRTCDGATNLIQENIALCAKHL